MSKSNDQKTAVTESTSKVIDLDQKRLERSTESLSEAEANKLKSLRVRFDLEQAKVAIPASLLSIVVVVTLANSKLLSGGSAFPEDGRVSHREQSSVSGQGSSRGLASIPTGTSESEDELVRRMSQTSLAEVKSVGRKPSDLEKLTLETLEGRYAIKVSAAQKIAEISLSSGQTEAIPFSANFLDKNKNLLPAGFSKSLRVLDEKNGTGRYQKFQLVNDLSRPIANVDVRLDNGGGLLSLQVQPL